LRRQLAALREQVSIDINSVRLTRRLVTAFVWRRRRSVLRSDVAEIIRAVVAEVAAAAMAPPSAMSETILAAIALVMAVRSISSIGILANIRLWLTAAGDESRQDADIWCCVIAALDWLHVGLILRLVWWLMWRPAVLLQIARRKRLRIARQIWLRLRHRRLRRIARLVLARERLAIVIVEIVVSCALRRSLLALRVRLIVVVGVLLAELFLRHGNQAEIMFGVLVIILGRHRISGTLRVPCELDVLLGDVRGSTTNFYVGPIRLVDPCEWILTFAVIVVATTTTTTAATSPHAFLTVSHDVPVRRPFASFYRGGFHRLLS
jgi:hypothetical protein